MKRKLSFIVILLVFILPVTLYAVFKAPYNDGAITASEGKPIVLEFSTPLCSECQKLNKVLDKVEPKYAGKITFQKINASLPDEDVIAKVEKYNVKLVPTMVFINRAGNTVAVREGSMQAKVLTSQLDELLK